MQGCGKQPAESNSCKQGKNEREVTCALRDAEPHLKAVVENKLGMQVRFSTIQLSYQNRSVFSLKVYYIYRINKKYLTEFYRMERCEFNWRNYV